MVAARILGWKQVGLGSILEKRFGVKLDKRYQRADWGRRPLSPEEIAYARDDTHYLIALRDLQVGELEQAGRLREAEEEFERLSRVSWSEREFDPNRYYTIEGARGLDPTALGVLRELYRFREERARQEEIIGVQVRHDLAGGVREAKIDGVRLTIVLAHLAVVESVAVASQHFRGLVG